jgi:hypothetical protein
MKGNDRIFCSAVSHIQNIGDAGDAMRDAGYTT